MGQSWSRKKKRGALSGRGRGKEKPKTYMHEQRAASREKSSQKGAEGGLFCGVGHCKEGERKLPGKTNPLALIKG